MPHPLRAIAEFFKRDWQRGRTREKNKWEERKHRCTRCWYDLRGGIGDVCPECGTPKNRGENIWTDGRWHWKVGTFFALAAVLVVLSLFAIAELIMLDAHWIALDQQNSNVPVPPSADPFLTHIPLAQRIRLLAEFGLFLSFYPIIFLTTHQSTLAWHQAIRLLAPLIVSFLIVWIGQELIGTIGRWMTSL